MVMLAASGFGLAQLARHDEDRPVWRIVDRDVLQSLAFHFDHPPWQSSYVPGTQRPGEGNPWLRWSVSFWDLIQPAFMFMVGVALPFSVGRRRQEGESPGKRWRHALLRAVVLVLLGVFLSSQDTSSTNWIFPNVLSQIGLGYFFVYLLAQRSPRVQIAALVLILVGTWAAVQFYPQPASWQPEEVNASAERGEVLSAPFAQWSNNSNAFHDFDVWILNLFPRPESEGPFLFNRGGYQTLNFVPSMATTLLGVLCGQLLLSPLPARRKLLYLLLAALGCWALGVIAGATCCPVVKRIWTPSWVLFSGGYVIGLFALWFALFDMLPLRRLAFPLVVVGMNSILVYMLGQLSRSWLIDQVVVIHFGGAIESVLGWVAVQSGWPAALGTAPASAGEAAYIAFAPIINSVAALLAIWLIAWWLYRQRIFFRI